MIAAVASALVSHWRRNPLQAFTLLAGLALATALWSGVQAINAEARASYDAAAATLGEGRFDQLEPRAGDTVPEARFVALRRAGWLVSPVVDGRIGPPDRPVRLVGLDPLTAPGDLVPVGENGTPDLEEFLGDTPVFADAATAERLDGLVTARIVVDPGMAPDTALTDIGHAQRLLGREGRISRLVLAGVQPLGRPALEDIAPDLVLRPAQQQADIGRLTDSFHLNLTAFGLLSFAVGLFIVNGAVGLAFEQRRSMVRTLRATGVPLVSLVAVMAAELLVFALLAGTLGVLLGYTVAALLLPDVAATLRGLYGAQVSGALQWRAAWWASGLGMALAGTALAAGGALWRIARMPLLASARPRAWSMAAGRGRRVMAGASLLLLLAAAALIQWGDGLFMGFALLASLLIGAALALPVLLDSALAAGQSRARGVLAQWFWADTRQQLPGLSLALMALLLAMAANIGVSTMVSSFRLTFVAFLDQRLAAELYVSTDSAEDASALQAFLEGRADTVLPIQWVDTRLAGVPSELYGARVGPTYTENWGFLDSLPDAWAQVASGGAVLVNEQLSRRAGLSVGDRIDIGGGTALPVAGIFGDYGNPIGQAIIDAELFADLHPDVQPLRFGLRSADPAALQKALEEDFGLPGARIIDQAAIKAFSLQVFDRTFTVTAALNVLTLAVAAFAILMNLLTLAALRVPQLAPAWALGLTRASLGRLELVRAVVLAALTTACALPLGLALAWVLLAVVNVDAFGWRLPMHVFPLDYLRLGALALVAAALAALWPARRLARTPPSDLLKVFANER